MKIEDIALKIAERHYSSRPIAEIDEQYSLKRIETLKIQIVEEFKQAQTLQLHNTDVRRSCNIVTYGEAERLCRTCGYVLWEDKGKSNEEILNDMVKIGYPKPDCMDNFA